MKLINILFIVKYFVFYSYSIIKRLINIKSFKLSYSEIRIIYRKNNILYYSENINKIEEIIKLC